MRALITSALLALLGAPVVAVGQTVPGMPGSPGVSTTIPRAATDTGVPPGSMPGTGSVPSVPGTVPGTPGDMPRGTIAPPVPMPTLPGVPPPASHGVPGPATGVTPPAGVPAAR
jgi:hypothetical protein